MCEITNTPLDDNYIEILKTALLNSLDEKEALERLEQRLIKEKGEAEAVIEERDRCIEELVNMLESKGVSLDL